MLNGKHIRELFNSWLILFKKLCRHQHVNLWSILDLSTGTEPC